MLELRGTHLPNTQKIHFRDSVITGFVKQNKYVFFEGRISRATASVLTSGKKRKQIISPNKVNFAVRAGQLGI